MVLIGSKIFLDQQEAFYYFLSCLSVNGLHSCQLNLKRPDLDIQMINLFISSLSLQKCLKMSSPYLVCIQINGWGFDPP